MVLVWECENDEFHLIPTNTWTRGEKMFLFIWNVSFNDRFFATLLTSMYVALIEEYKQEIGGKAKDKSAVQTSCATGFYVRFVDQIYLTPFIIFALLCTQRDNFSNWPKHACLWSLWKSQN